MINCSSILLWYCNNIELLPSLVSFPYLSGNESTDLRMKCYQLLCTGDDAIMLYPQVSSKHSKECPPLLLSLSQLMIVTTHSTSYCLCEGWNTLLSTVIIHTLQRAHTDTHEGGRTRSHTLVFALRNAKLLCSFLCGFLLSMHPKTVTMQPHREYHCMLLPQVFSIRYLTLFAIQGVQSSHACLIS